VSTAGAGERPGSTAARGPAVPGLVVSEIYRSIQGESTFAGLPCTFVRLTACHLRCSYCDTTHAFHGGRRIPVAEVIREVVRQGGDLAEVTGGEPLLQRAVHPLMSGLADRGVRVLLETSGALDIGPVDPRVHIIMDLKCPGSGECDANLWSNIERLQPKDEVKFVIADRADFEWSCAAIRRHALARRCGAVLLSPVFGRLDPRLLAEWILAERLAARLQVQLHKYLWPPDRRGV